MKKEKQKEPECATIRITLSVRKALNILKAQLEKNSVSEVIEGLLKK